MAVQSRSKGNRFELYCAKKLSEVFNRKVVSSRSESRSLDARKVDLVHTEPFRIQCKHVESSVPYFELMNEMDSMMLPNEVGINVILHKKNNLGAIAILKRSDLMMLSATETESATETDLVYATVFQTCGHEIHTTLRNIKSGQKTVGFIDIIRNNQRLVAIKEEDFYKMAFAHQEFYNKTHNVCL